MQRLIIHAGTPKTGTTSLQYALAENREALRQQGWIYPVTPADALKPKHQWLVDDIMNADVAAFRENINAVWADADPAATIVLSTEGVFNHWWDFPEAGKALLAALAIDRKVEVWVWFREPTSFFASLYVQLLKNSRGNVPCQGGDLSPQQMLKYDWFRKRFDYIGFTDQVKSLLGVNAVRVFKYRRSTIADFVKAAGLSPIFIAERDDNPSLGELGVEIVRSINRREMNLETRFSAISLAQQIDALSGRRPLEISPAVIADISELAAVSIERLKTEFSVDLRI